MSVGSPSPRRPVAPQVTPLQLDESTVPFRPGGAVFVTLTAPHPRAGCRPALPPSLSRLLRPCALAPPELAQVGEVLLFAAGVPSAAALARRAAAVLRVSRLLLFDEGDPAAAACGLGCLRGAARAAAAAVQAARHVLEPDLYGAHIPDDGATTGADTADSAGRRLGQGASDGHGHRGAGQEVGVATEETGVAAEERGAATPPDVDEAVANALRDAISPLLRSEQGAKAFEQIVADVFGARERPGVAGSLRLQA